ncbi:hypothetical protein [Serratia ficaria]|uniref:hypothetical protein n=1 Tax=Serratia ficaria TaxID=61651 RepID=UPI00217AFFCE|nr:hypothetical protein [Serratia ficaria]CAI1807022.1 Uncharacterised protein [Serratia ficaria]
MLKDQMAFDHEWVIEDVETAKTELCAKQIDQYRRRYLFEAGITVRFGITTEN